MTHQRNGNSNSQAYFVSDLLISFRFYDHPIVNGVRKQSKHDILPPSTKEFFRQRTFTCYEYANLNNQVEENMFQLVQRGMPLTPAEKLQALSTKWAAFTKQYEADYNGIVNCK